MSKSFYNFALAIEMKRGPHIYKVTLEDRSHLRELRSYTFSRTRLIAVSVASIVVFLTVVALLLILSMRFIRDNDPNAAVENQLHSMSTRLDSLRYAAELNDSFIGNIRTVLDIDRQPSDSLSAGVLLKSLPLDSLMTGSPAERRFVASMGEREKYNLRVLSPVAADGMIFSNPVEGGIVAEDSGNRFMVRMIVPLGGGVCSVADGIILDTYSSDKADRYTILIQHANGFVSRYSDVGTPLVENGTTVYAGQIISAPASSSRRIADDATVGVELWHDGTPLYPADYIFPLSRH